MAITSNSYTGNGSTTLYSFTFPYLDESHVKITLNGTLTTAYTFANATTIQFNTAPGAGVAIRIYRETNNDQTEATFFAGSSIKAQDLNNNFTQTLYTVQEVVDRYLSKVGDTMQGILNMGGFKITNLGAPTSGTDATTKTYVDTQDALKVNKAGDTMSGNLAMGGNKVTGLGSPSGSADAATKSYVDGYINTTYLGPSATDPTTRPGGSPLQVGDQYFNTNQNILKAWTGTVWVISAAAGSIVRWRKTASAGNTTLSGVDDLGITLSYVVGNEQVYLNGALQTRGVDYTAATGISITFTPALLAGDVVELHAVQGYVSATITPGSINDALVAPAAGIQYSKLALSNSIVNADVNASAGIVATKLAFTQSGTGAAVRTVDSKLKDVVSVKDFGAIGDGTTNDTVAIQAAIDSLVSGGIVYFPPGTYRVARNTGTNDRWGIKVTGSNITLLGYGATLRRFNTDISTYALAYPILMVGTPDSNVASATQNIEVIGLTFTGENTRHSTAGSALSDGRYAIALKNTVNTIISDCRFDAIDSEAIFTQAPYNYDYANSAYYNTTKNYRLRIKDCLFNATSHATNGRALMHTVNLSGVDDAVVSNNQFFWCDNAVIGSGTYDAPTNTENDTWTPGGGWALGAIKRTGRNWVITGNVVRNSSEHAFYPEGMDVTITGNNIMCESTTICAYDQIKVRSRVCNVTGNTISNCVYGITASQPSFEVTISGNTINAVGGEGGVIGIEAIGLTTYINNRPFLGNNYRPMQNIAITGNTITLKEAAHSSNDGSAIRIYTDYTDANFTDQVRNVTIEGNTIQNHRSGIYIIGNKQATILIKGNIFRAKPFTLGSFSTSTTLNTYATLLVSRGASQSTTTLREFLFTGNYVYGTTYIYATTDGLGSGYDTPWGNQSNRFDYVKYISTSDVNAFSMYNQFTNNSGIYFLDRTWSGSALNNSFFGGAGSYPELRQTFFWTGTNVRFYTNDSGSFVLLN